jgi:hypothetical protein
MFDFRNKLVLVAELWMPRQIYSKPSLIRLKLIRMPNNPKRNMKNAVHS